MKEITTIGELKSIELQIMKKLHCFCEENNVAYYMCYGTLLGAVRHKGFIPWDDDIDLYMKRSEYTRFLEICKEKSEELTKCHLELVNRFTERYFGRIISKVIDTRTVLIESEYKTDDPIGVFVDIWPLDGTPNNKLFRIIYIAYARFIKRLLLASSMNYSPSFPLIKRVLIRFGGFFDPKKVLEHLDRIAQKYSPEESEYLASYCDLTNVYKSSDFDMRVLMSFEDSKFYAPANYDSLLRDDYGNYMDLPPLKDREPHHVVSAFYK